MKKQMQYTIMVTPENVTIYIRRKKTDEFEFSFSFGIDQGGVSVELIHKLIELANLGYQQIP